MLLLLLLLLLLYKHKYCTYLTHRSSLKTADTKMFSAIFCAIITEKQLETILNSRRWYIILSYHKNICLYIFSFQQRQLPKHRRLLRATQTSECKTDESL